MVWGPSTGFPRIIPCTRLASCREHHLANKQSFDPVSTDRAARPRHMKYPEMTSFALKVPVNKVDHMAQSELYSNVTQQARHDPDCESLFAIWSFSSCDKLCVHLHSY